GGTVTVKFEPLLATPPTATKTLPVIAPLGTGATMLVGVQLVGTAVTPLNITVLAPCDKPKFVPVIVTDVPTSPRGGLRLATVGGGGAARVKVRPLLGCPPTVTTTFPVVAPLGTGTPMLVALQLVGVAGVPLNVTALLPRVAPKFVPVMVNEVPTGPLAGLKLLTTGLKVTVKVTRLLPTVPTTTYTRSSPIGVPVGTGTVMLVALQLVGAVGGPLMNMTLLVPCAAPKFVPVIVTRVPAGPETGFKAEMFGGLGA